MNKYWKKITPSVAIIAGVAFMSHSMEFDNNDLAINIKQLHAPHERPEPPVTKTTFVITTASAGTTSTTSTTIDPRLFTR